MSKEPQIQIPKKAFLDLYRLIFALDGYELDYDTKELAKSLEMVLENKFEAMTRRQAFTEYKIADPSTEDRETKRKRYLELEGIHHDWISQKEIPL